MSFRFHPEADRGGHEPPSGAGLLERSPLDAEQRAADDARTSRGYGEKRPTGGLTV